MTDEAERIDLLLLENVKPRYEAWIQHLCEKRTLLKNMMSCSVLLHNEQIKIDPSRHVQLEAWSGMESVDSVFLTPEHTAEEIGVGLRLALSRCR